MKHVHAELMAEYAKDALASDKPWESWEFFGVAMEWRPCTDHPKWRGGYQYRRKQKVIKINGFDIPEPLHSADPATTVYVSDPLKMGLFYTVCAGHVQRYRFERGLVHATKEAAILHARALLSFTKIG